jgi:hypothetical protein
LQHNIDPVRTQHFWSIASIIEVTSAELEMKSLNPLRATPKRRSMAVSLESPNEPALRVLISLALRSTAPAFQ